MVYNVSPISPLWEGRNEAVVFISFDAHLVYWTKPIYLLYWKLEFGHKEKWEKVQMLSENAVAFSI